MMRTIEVILAIVIVFAAVLVTALYAKLPPAQELSTPLLSQQGYSALNLLSTDGFLAQAVFSPPESPEWVKLQIALNILLPSDVVYNLTVYRAVEEGGVLRYSPVRSVSNFEGNVTQRRATVSYSVISPYLINATLPEKVDATLYILNCSDAHSWGLGGYTVPDLANAFREALTPYFQTVIAVNSTSQLDDLLTNNTISGETGQNAVVLNTFGEAVPIPYTYDDDDDYMELLGERVAEYNWTWVSIVGYPFSYVTNTNKTDWFTYGIYGINKTAYGLNDFLQGLSADGTASWITPPSVVRLSANAMFFANKYGIYVQPNQTCTYAFSIADSDITVDPMYGYVFNNITDGGVTYLPGANFVHKEGDEVKGVLTVLGLAPNPDYRLAVLALLMHYHPAGLETGYAGTDVIRIVVLELGQVGGD